MRKLRFLLSWVMVFTTCCLALSGGALAYDRGSTFGIVNTGSKFSWSPFVVGSVSPASRVSVPSGSLYNAGASSGALFRATIGNFELGAEETLQTGTYISAVTLTELVTVQDIRKSLHGVVRYTLEVGSNLGGDSTLYVFASSVEMQVLKTDNSTIIWHGELSKNGEDFLVDADFPMQTVGFVKFIVKFNSTTKTNTTGGQVRSVGLTGRTTVRWDGESQSTENVSDILDGVNEGNSLQAETNGILYNVIDTIASLPGKIADAIKGLFVPTDAQMEELKSSFNVLLSEKLGFVYQSVSLVDGVFDAVFDAADNPNSDVSFTVPAFPSFDVGGTEVSLWDYPVVVDIADNEFVQTVQQVASPFVVAVMVWGFVHSMEDAFLAFVGGHSLADWVRNRKGGTE